MIKADPIFFYRTSEIDEYVPKKPGLYAWYLYEPLSETVNVLDYEKLTDLSKKFGGMDIKLESNKANKEFGYYWTGSIKKEQSHDESKKLLDESDRSYVLSNFNLFFPAFASPVYIGTSKNLHSRLTNHVKYLENYEDLPSADQNSTEGNDKNFASRANRQNIKSHNLVFTFLVVEKNINGEDDGNARERIEQLLNGINQPILGKR